MSKILIRQSLRRVAPLFLALLMIASATTCANAIDADQAGTIPCMIALNLVFVGTQINGLRPIPFAIDTSISKSILDPAAAKALHLIPTLSGKTTLASVSGLRLSWGTTALPDQSLALTSLAPLTPLLGKRIDGILGADILHHFVVRIDYAKSTLGLIDPADYHSPDASQAVPLIVKSGIPYINSTIIQPNRPPIDALLKIDTGTFDALTLTGGFALDKKVFPLDENEILQYGTQQSATDKQFVARLQELKIGPYVFKQPIVGHTLDTRRESYAGTLGGDILRRFTVTLDYAGHQLLLEPNAAFDAPFQYDASGLFVTANPSDIHEFIVQSVRAYSPAADAQIQSRDVITAINGQAAANLTLAQLRAMLTHAGITYPITIKRGDKSITSSIALIKLI